MYHGGFTGDTVIKNPAASAGDARDAGLGRSPGEGNGNALQNFCLGSRMNRGVRWATVHGASKSQT